MPLPATQRLWIVEPARRTALARVLHVAGGWFVLDRSLFAPTSRTHRHPQPADRGTVWVEGGEKRLLVDVRLRDGVLWHRLRGTVPPVGAQLNCQLDQELRERASRAHTAMHLLLAAAQADGEARPPPLAADPAVKGGGTFRLEFAAHGVAPRRLAAWLQQANHWAQEDRRVAVEHVVRGMEARVLDAQAFEPPDPYPGPPDVVDAVRIAGVCCYPCDGTHVARTGLVGQVVVTHAAGRGGRFVVAARVR